MMPSLLDWLLEHEPLFRKTRLPSLYSDLSVQKSSNPEGYAANVQAWQSALTRAALAGQLPTEQLYILQTSDELLSALSSPQYGRPSGIGAVVDDSVQGGKIIDVNDFMQAEKSIYHKSWIPSPWSILRWSLRQAGLMSTSVYDISGRLKSGNLVLVQALEEVSNKVITWRTKQGDTLPDRILSQEAFTKELPTILGTSHIPTSQELSVLLRYLSRDQMLLSFDSTTIKFKASSQSQAEPITQEDISIANLKQLITALTAQVTSLEATISMQQQRAASYVAQKNKMSAIGALRSKKRAEQALQQRTATLQQLEDVFSSIEQAADQITIVETLQSSANTLKALNKKVGDVDKIEDVIDDLREQMGKTEEVSNVLQEPLKDDAIGDVEVDEEFEAMEREERERDEKQKEKEMQKRLEAAGQVPMGDVEKEQAEKEDGLLNAELSKSVEKMQDLDLGDNKQERLPQQAQ